MFNLEEMQLFLIVCQKKGNGTAKTMIVVAVAVETLFLCQSHIAGENPVLILRHKK